MESLNEICDILGRLPPNVVRLLDTFVVRTSDVLIQRFFIQACKTDDETMKRLLPEPSRTHFFLFLEAEEKFDRLTDRLKDLLLDFPEPPEQARRAERQIRQLLSDMNIECRRMDHAFRMFHNTFDPEEAKKLAEAHKFDQKMKYAGKCLVVFAGGACLGAVGGAGIALRFGAPVVTSLLVGAGIVGALFLLSKVLYSYGDLQMYLKDVDDNLATGTKAKAVLDNKMFRMKLVVEELLREGGLLDERQQGREYAQVLLSWLDGQLGAEGLLEADAPRPPPPPSQDSTIVYSLQILLNRPTSGPRSPPAAPLLSAAGAGALTGAAGAILVGAGALRAAGTIASNIL